jgi:hypothetical protein
MKSGIGIRRKKVTNASSPGSLNGPASWPTETLAKKPPAKFQLALEGALGVAAERGINPPAPALAHAS